MPDFNRIKDTTSIYDVATKQLGMNLRAVGDGEYRGVSIAPGSHTHDNGFSLQVDSGEWHDHTLGMGGDIIDLVAYVKFGSINEDTRREAGNFLDGDTSGGNWKKHVEEQEKFEADIEKYHEALLRDERTLEYIHDRRITDETIKKYKLGVGMLYNGEGNKELRLACPYFNRYGKPVYLISRMLSWEACEKSAKYVKKKVDEHFKNIPYGLNTLKKDSDTLIIAEGMFDALSFIQEGYNVLSPITGNFGKENIPTVLKEAAKYRRIFTTYDCDGNESGQRFTCRMGKHFLHAGIAFRAVPNFGEGNKDVSDYYTKGGNLQELLDSAVNGYVFMAGFSFWENTPKKLEGSFFSLSKAEKDKALSEVKQFVYKLKMFLEPKEFNEVMQALALFYPEDKLEKYAEGPTAQEILEMQRDEFLEGKHFMFSGSEKGGEIWRYDDEDGYWYMMTDADLQAQISAHFKHKLENKRIRNLAMMVRLICTPDILPEFNRAGVEVFTNGTLEKDTLVFREHRPEDFATRVRTFAYDEKATCPTYDKFLADITDNEQSRIDFLDDVMGYILMEGCKQQKLFFLIGEGSNGKSTWLKVLEMLYENGNKRAGTKTVSHVQPASLDKPTEMYQLRHSVLNICADISYKLRGVEPFLKRIAGGDEISGNLKFHDTVDFTPTAKHIFSTNRMMEVSDDSYGLRRKIMFCRFIRDFTNNADTSLETKLKAELPGIFNRSLKAYIALKERMKTQGIKAIRETIDQDELITEFRQTASPVAAFWNKYGEELVERQEVPTEEVFDMYRDFCERNSLRAGTSDRFGEALKNILKEVGIEREKTRHRENGKQVSYYAFIRGSETHAENPEPTLEQVIADGVIELDDEADC